MRELNEKCGIFGVFSLDEESVARTCVTGLQMLQHRGQEGSGISIANGEKMITHKNIYLVNHIFTDTVVDTLVGNAAIGHNRYSTSAGTGKSNVQPFVVDPGKMIEDQSTGALTIHNGRAALAHNGNIPCTEALETFLADKNIEAVGQSDTALMTAAVGYYIKEGLSVEDAVAEAYPLFTGAFSLLLLTQDTMVAVRDAHGIRPLSIGRRGDDTLFSSETCAFSPVGATYDRDVRPGEMVVVTRDGMKSVQITDDTEEKLDIFEFVYFARPDSVLHDRSVYDVRRAFGEELAEECPIDADIVIPVPETAMPAALGYASKKDIPLDMALVKSRYSHRTFIQPDQDKRAAIVRMKFAPIPEMIAGKRVVLIDDSIVRGTTTREIVKMLFAAGASEVHIRVSSAPIRFPDFYGIDTPEQSRLIAAGKTEAEISEELGATSVCYLSVDGMVKATGQSADKFCLSCFTGDYPIDIGKNVDAINFQ